MTKNKWFKCYPGDFLNGVVRLKPDELAVYTICIMQMYDDGGPIPNDPEIISRRCVMRPSTCRKAIDVLVRMNKLSLNEGMLFNERVGQTLESVKKLSEKQSQNSRARWENLPEKPNEIKGGAMPPESQTDPTSIPTRSQKLEVETPPYPPQAGDGKRKSNRGTRLPEDMTLPDDWRAWAVEAKHPNPAAEWDVFRDYWISRAGQGGSKVDWQAVWRNWVRKALAEGRAAGGPSSRTGGRTDASNVVALGMAGARADAALVERVERWIKGQAWGEGARPDQNPAMLPDREWTRLAEAIKRRGAECEAMEQIDRWETARAWVRRKAAAGEDPAPSVFERIRDDASAQRQFGYSRERLRGFVAQTCKAAGLTTVAEGMSFADEGNEAPASTTRGSA